MPKWLIGFRTEPLLEQWSWVQKAIQEVGHELDEGYFEEGLVGAARGLLKVLEKLTMVAESEMSSSSDICEETEGHVGRK